MKDIAANEKIEVVRLTAEKLMIELVGLPGDIAVMSLIEAANRVVKTLRKCDNVEACDSLIEVINQIKTAEQSVQ